MHIHCQKQYMKFPWKWIWIIHENTYMIYPKNLKISWVLHPWNLWNYHENVIWRCISWPMHETTHGVPWIKCILYHWSDLTFHENIIVIETTSMRNKHDTIYTLHTPSQQQNFCSLGNSFALNTQLLTLFLCFLYYQRIDQCLCWQFSAFAVPSCTG